VTLYPIEPAVNNQQGSAVIIALFIPNTVAKAVKQLLLPQMRPNLQPRESSLRLERPDPICVVCERPYLDLAEWFDCASACALCADFFRRICIGADCFVYPEDCVSKNHG
jgi:hypothetical protein